MSKRQLAKTSCRNAFANLFFESLQKYAYCCETVKHLLRIVWLITMPTQEGDSILVYQMHKSYCLSLSLSHTFGCLIQFQWESFRIFLGKRKMRWFFWKGLDFPYRHAHALRIMRKQEQKVICELQTVNGTQSCGRLKDILQIFPSLLCVRSSSTTPHNKSDRTN